MKKFIAVLLFNFIIGIKLRKGFIESYEDNPDEFISSHSNEENFIAMFSNYTKNDGERLYRNYIENRKRKGPQFVIDKINNLGSKNVDKWEYDTNLKKFKLSEESTYP